VVKTRRLVRQQAWACWTQRHWVPAFSAGVTAFPDNITNQLFHMRGSADMRENGHGGMDMYCPRPVDFAGDIFVHMPSCGKKVGHDANVRGALSHAAVNRLRDRWHGKFEEAGFHDRIITPHLPGDHPGQGDDFLIGGLTATAVRNEYKCLHADFPCNLVMAVVSVQGPQEIS